MALKNELLALLEENQGKTLSGAELAEKFDVSRNAVWKAVNALRDEGHDVESVGKKGYRLNYGSDLISEEGISVFLSGRAAEMYDKDILDIHILGKTSSTNDEAKKICALCPDINSVCIAEQQTAGRGRFGRSFYSPAYTGLYLSAVTHPDKSLENSLIYTAAAAVAAIRAIENITSVKPKIKWINDLYIPDQDGEYRKIGGILTEAVSDFETGKVQSLISGVGINVTTEKFPEELSEKACSLGRCIRRNRLAAELISQLYELYSCAPSEFMQEYRDNCFLIGREIVFFDGKCEYVGKVIEIGDSCELILQTSDGVRSFRHGEIKSF